MKCINSLLSCGINSDLNSTISNPITLSPNLWSNSIGCLTLILMVMKEAQMVFIAKFNEAQFLEAIKVSLSQLPKCKSFN